MLPTLSLLSVRKGPENRLRHWCSSRYLRIPPLHREFHSPLPSSSQPVSQAGPGLSPEFSLTTQPTAYKLFTPNNSGQRSHPTYHRGCWHVVSRCFFCRYRHLRFVPTESGLQPEGRHPARGVAASGFRPLCNIPTAASRRSLGRISVPMWPVALSGRLPVDALVSHYLTNKLIGRETILDHKSFPNPTMRQNLNIRY